MRDEILNELIKNPYKYICDFAEGLYPYTGGLAFKFLSLLPCSLIINDTPYLSKKEKTNMNILFLSPPGSAKSSICKQFARFTYFPLEGRSYTPAELENKSFKLKTFSLIIEDYATMSMDERINKIIEGCLGEEKVIDRHTTKKDIREDIEAIGLLCGVPEDLSGRITSGTLSRVICLLILHDDEEHSKIGKYISEKLGNHSKKEDYENKEKMIKKYYDLLFEIQEEKYKEYPKIESIYLQDNIKERIYEKWDNITKRIRKNIPFNYFRELHDSYRIAINHCFLNYFNRKIEGNTIFANYEDCDVAIELNKINLINKYKILLSEKIGRSLRTIKELNTIMKSERYSEDLKRLIPLHINKKLK